MEGEFVLDSLNLIGKSAAMIFNNSGFLCFVNFQINRNQVVAQQTEESLGDKVIFV